MVIFRTIEFYIHWIRADHKFRKKVDGLEESARTSQSQICDLEKRLEEKVSLEKENQSQKITDEYKTAIRKLKSQLKLKMEENESLRSKTNSFQAENDEKLNQVSLSNEQLKNDLKSLNSSKEKELSVLEQKIAEMIELCATLEKEKLNELNKNQTLKQTIEQVLILRGIRLTPFLVNLNITYYLIFPKPEIVSSNKFFPALNFLVLVNILSSGVQKNFRIEKRQNVLMEKILGLRYFGFS